MVLLDNMRLVFLGAPGSGKGSASTRLETYLNLTHISTGDIFRAAIKDQTPAGLEAKYYMDNALLVPDEVTLKIVLERLQNDDCKNGFIFDGFPRTLKQAEIYDQQNSSGNYSIDHVIYLKVDEDKLIDRIKGRRVCPKCGASYHIVTLKPKVDGICDRCGSELVIRKDDNEESMKVRLNEYNNLTAPLIEYYKKSNRLIEIDGMQPIDKVFEDILAALGVK
jgi:adenylate kinase